MPPPIKEPPSPMENPDAPVREPDPEEPEEIGSGAKLRSTASDGGITHGSPE
jgi:hypothetical protein